MSENVCYFCKEVVKAADFQSNAFHGKTMHLGCYIQMADAEDAHKLRELEKENLQMRQLLESLSEATFGYYYGHIQEGHFVIFHEDGDGASCGANFFEAWRNLGKNEN